MKIFTVIKDKCSGLELKPLLPAINRKNILKYNAYLLYALLVFTLIFGCKYFALQTDYLLRENLNTVKNLSFEFPDFKPQLLPPRVTLSYIHILEKKSGKLLLTLGKTNLKLSLAALLTGKFDLDIKSRAYGTDINANLKSQHLFDFSKITASLQLELLELEQIPQLTNYDKTIKGFLNLKASLQGPPNNLMQMQANLSAQINRLELENNFFFIKGTRLQNYTFNIKSKLKNTKLNIQNLDLNNQKDISLNINGTATLKNNINQTALNLTGQFKAPINKITTSILDKKAIELLKKEQPVPLSLTGTINTPNLKVK